MTGPRERTSSGLFASARILVVDDDELELSACADALRVVTDVPPIREAKSNRAAELLQSEQFDLLVTDLRMPAIDGIDLLRIAHSHDPELPVLILTGFPSIDTAVETLKLGAADYLTKPVNQEELIFAARRVLNERRMRGEHRLLQRQVERPYAFDDIVGESAAMRSVFEAIERVAETNVDVLILGETGTGKELVARSIHKRSISHRFVPVDCGAIPENLLESEFFGHEKGAFTGAHARSTGLMEFADSGTLFLDEITSLQVPLQAKLLRVLQERKFRRLGATRETSVSFRVVAAANRDPVELIKSNRFREDLYYRLNVGRIELPPLRERSDDIPLLVHHFMDRYSQEMTRSPLEVSPDAMEVLVAYPWPGNVRELQNLVKRILAMTRHEVLTPENLPEEVVTQAVGRQGGGRGTFFRLRAERVAAFEKEYLVNLLKLTAGDVTAAAIKADVPRGTFYRLMKRHDLAAQQFRRT